VWHLERGYEDMVGKLASVGGRIKVVSVETETTTSDHIYE
jgi:UDP-N-acetylglucosamine enolpyruvyl transferase